ncbi:hypothetical protein INR49_005083, partial [Caranx melampygus]
MMMMVSALLLGLVLVSVGGLWGGLQAAALPLVSTVQVRVGEDATLQCPLLASTRAVNNSTLSWYRKVEGGSPQLLLTIKSRDGFAVRLGTGVGPEKVSAAADGSLLLRRSDHKDSAVYYCGISQGGRTRDQDSLRPNLTSDLLLVLVLVQTEPTLLHQDSKSQLQTHFDFRLSVNATTNS